MASWSARDPSLAVRHAGPQQLRGVPEPGNPIGKRITLQLAANRRNLDDAFLFELPDAWLSTGQRELAATIAVTAEPSVLPDGVTRAARVTLSKIGRPADAVTLRRAAAAGDRHDPAGLRAGAAVTPYRETASAHVTMRPGGP